MSQQFLVALCGEYAKAYVERFLQQAAAPLRMRSTGIEALAARWIGRPHDLSTAWHPLHGLIRAFVRGGSEDPLPLAAQLSLLLASGGVEGHAEIRMHSPRRLRVHRWLLPEATGLHLDSQPSELRVRVLSQGRWHEHRFARPDGRALSLSGSLLDEAPRIHRQGQDFLVLQGLGAHGFGVEVEARDDLRVAWSEVRSLSEQALDLLHEVSPTYLPWVGNVLREVAPLDGTREQMRSGSDEVYDGRIHVSYPAYVPAVSEMFIHETTHLYFALAKRFEDLDNGQDPTLYDSPVKGTGRPIEKILLAYHAFANVVLFYKDCVDAGRDVDGYCAKNIERHRPELLKLREALLVTNGLTQAGIDVWQPLDERLHWM